MAARVKTEVRVKVRVKGKGKGKGSKGLREYGSEGVRDGDGRS
jgi:hypothetical protein